MFQGTDRAMRDLVAACRITLTQLAVQASSHAQVQLLVIQVAASEPVSCLCQSARRNGLLRRRSSIPVHHSGRKSPMLHPPHYVIYLLSSSRLEFYLPRRHRSRPISINPTLLFHLFFFLPLLSISTLTKLEVYSQENMYSEEQTLGGYIAVSI